MREWAAKRVGELQEIINRMEPFEGVTTASHAARRYQGKRAAVGLKL
jgi:hypothetical protein